MDLGPVEAKGQIEMEVECAEIRQAHSDIRIVKVEPIERYLYEIEELNTFKFRSDELSATSENILILEADPLEEIKLEPPETTLKCYICSADLNTNEDLQQHMEAVHRRSLKCAHCEQFFSRKGPLEKHLKAHQPESAQIPEIPSDPIFCIICDLMMKSQDEVTSHFESHENDSPFECPDCADLFEDIKIFQDHLKQHKVKAKKMPGKTTRHIRVNASDKTQSFIEEFEITPPGSPTEQSFSDYEPIASYPCDQCGKLFIDELILKKHKKIHDEPPKSKTPLPVPPIDVQLVSPPFLCNICDRKFTDEFNLNKHKKTHDEALITQTENFSVSPSPETLQSDVIAESHLLFNEISSEGINLNELEEILPTENGNSLDTITHPKPDIKTRTFACNQCDRSFTQAKTLVLHIRQGHHGIKPYKCDICHWSFGQSCELTSHKKIHTSQHPYKCKHCEQSFSQKRNLINHSKIHTNDLIKCKYCGHEFRLGSSMLKHLKRHEGEQIWSCPHCDIPYSAPKYLDLHVKRMHTSIFACMNCDKTFTTQGSRNRHSRKHAGLFPYPCKICSKSFKEKALLRSHQVIHRGRKSFQCSYCGQSFSYAGNLKVHARIHTGERPYECKVCKKTFVRTANLNEHMRTHTGKKVVKCEVCGKDFSSATTFSKHKKIHTGERPYKCHICEKTFRQSIHLSKHIMVHTGEKPFPCEICGRFFRRKDSLKTHVNRHLLRKSTKKTDKNVKDKEENNVQEIKTEIGNSESETMESGDENEENATEILQEIKIEIVDDVWL